MKYLVCDLDQTAINTATPWWEWMCDLTGHYTRHIPKKDPCYDLSGYFINLYAHKYSVPYEIAHKKLLSYWSIPNLYSDLKPLEGCYESLKELSDKGWWITFASYTKKGHFESKFDFLEREFDFIEWDQNGSFVATKEKGCLMADVVIDDRNSHLNQYSHRPEVLKIRYDTPFTQEVPLYPDATCMNHWEKLIGIIEGRAGI
jgi:5'(3')-deoxyribonucleotidase